MRSIKILITAVCLLLLSGMFFSGVHADSINIELKKGWNLISIPLDVTSGLEVFSESGADSVLSFDGNWEYWINGEGDLVELGFGRGYFVHSNSDMSLSFEGHEPISEVVKISRTNERSYQENLVKTYVFSNSIKDYSMLYSELQNALPHE